MYIIYAIIIFLLSYSIYKYSTDKKVEYIPLGSVGVLLLVLAVLATQPQKSISIQDVQDLIKNTQQ